MGKKRGVEDQGQGLKYSFLFTTHLFSLFGIFIMDIHSFKKKNFFFFLRGQALESDYLRIWLHLLLSWLNSGKSLKHSKPWDSHG